MRMDRNTFTRLCFLLENVGGLVHIRHIQISEQVVIFLTILAHHKKNRVVKFTFKRSGYTISKYFNDVLTSLLKLHTVLLVNPELVENGCTNKMWKWFKGCLGELDGTYIKVRVPQTNKAWYKNRKGKITVNVLGVCDENMKFVYILSSWRIQLLTTEFYEMPSHHIEVSDTIWMNGMTGPPHLKNYRELFNLKHPKARNVIKRSFSLLKSQWAILRSSSYYPIKTQNRIIMAYCLLHNFIRTTIAIDLLEAKFPKYMHDQCNEEDNNFVEQVESSQLWTNWRDNLVMAIRSWTVKKEQVLVSALKYLILRDWKLFLGTDLKANPHINSKIHVCKKNYDSLSTILSRSGFRWNDVAHTLDAWPYYKDLCDIFGKDRAMGENAKAFVDVIEGLFTNSEKIEDRFLDLMTSFYDKTEARLGDLAKRIGFKHDASASRNVLCNNTNDLDLFFSLSDEMKGVMDKKMLDGRI
ncbi:hypothetical protein Pfo_021927 [Paulownia fortunei]|nr:hypothetical protein Pfo_021927 [Paulownia fortunei]